MIQRADFDYELINFTAEGEGFRENAPLHPDPSVTDVLIMSHGWKGDVPGAIEQYDRWFGALNDQLHTVRAKRSIQPLYIGLHWPSLPFGDESLAAAFDTDQPRTPEEIVELYSNALGDTPRVRELVGTVVEEMAEHAAELTPVCIEALVQLGAEAGVGGDADSAPGHDGPTLNADSFRAVNQANFAEVTGPLNFLVQLSFWKMKQRARSVGESGVHSLLIRLLQTFPAARFHLMGHSLGSIVVSAAVGGPGGNSHLPRPIHSLALVQGAVSLWAYASSIALAGGKPGYFHRVLDHSKVAGPVIVTQSSHDSAVGRYFRWSSILARAVDFSAGAAAGPFDIAPAELPRFGGIGTYGIQGLSNPGFQISKLTMLDLTGTYALSGGNVYNIDGSEFILEHNTIDGPQVARALWAAAL
jgi:hypothetical protein